MFNGGDSISTQIKNAVKFILNKLKHNIKLRKLAVSIASFAVILTVMLTVLGVSNLTYALSVSVNGASYGYVGSEQEASAAIDNLLSRYVGDGSAPDVSYIPTVVPSNSVMSSGELADKIVEHSDEYITATAIFVNGSLFAKSESVAAAEELIISKKGDGELFNSVEIRESVMSPESYESLEDLSAVYDSSIEVTVKFHVNESTTLAEVAAAYSAFGADDSAPSAVVAGTVLNINTVLPVLAVENISQTVTERNVSAKESGTKAGILTVTKRVHSINGVNYKTELVSEVFTEKYADKPIATKIENAGDKGFCWPVDTGYTQYTSSYWGDGRGHSGYDIACKTGTPILAANDGYVQSVNASGSGYGLHFIIKHNNGLSTLYSHCSKLYVSVGDKVERGEVVALVGTTGRVTGSHLHFEVRNGSSILNPINYIGKR